MKKRSYVWSLLIIWSILSSMMMGPGGDPSGAAQSEMGRIVVSADDWPISDRY